MPYDVMTDKHVLDHDEAARAKQAGWTEPGADVQAGLDRGYTPWPDARYQALQAALQAAKLGLAHDIYQTAVRYAAWLSGGEPDQSPPLPFKARLRNLVDECLQSGEVDHDLVIHEMQVVMGIEAVVKSPATIEELEKILTDPEVQVDIQPDGTVKVSRKETP